MALSNPVSPGKKRMDSLNQLRRERPLFANRRPKGLQHQSEFLTESLNTSFVPSPSPQRSPVRSPPNLQHSQQPKGSGRLLTSAFRATKTQGEEIRPSTSSSINNQGLNGVSKPMPSPTKSPFAHRNHYAPSTPSPPRGRQGYVGSPASSASASSPPRGLAEAYQRIVDEENLAQDDSQLFDDTEDFIHHPQAAYERMNERIMQRKRDSGSPMSIRTLRKSTSTLIEPKAANGSVDEEATQHSSPHSLTEDATHSSLDSGLSQRAKDAQRVAGAINSDFKAFSKAKIGPRHSLSAQMLHRRNGSVESLQSSKSGSIDSRLSEPSMNVPRAWGRKSRPTQQWLDRIKSPSGRLTGDSSRSLKIKSPIIAESESKGWDEPIDKWIQAAAAKTPLPDGEGSSQAQPSSQDTAQAANGLPASGEEDTRGWDNDEFTAQSLQVSHSPPLRARTPTLGHIHSQELNSLERRAVTTNRLGELRASESREQLRRTSGKEEPGWRKIEKTPKAKNDLRGGPGDIVENDQVIADIPVVISPGTDGEGPKRPEHARQESHDLLRRLARTTSNSPRLVQDQNQELRMLKGSIDDSALPARRESEHKAPQQPPLPKPAKTPQVTGGWVDTILKATPKPSFSDSSLKPSKQYLQTPLITGAWIDTPLPIGGRGPPMPTPSAMDEETTVELINDDKRKVAASELIRKLSPRTARASLKTTAPRLPRSALESVVSAAKSDATAGNVIDSEEDGDDQTALHLGDSTIASLEEILISENNLATSHPPIPPSSAEDNTTTTLNSVSITPYTRQLRRLQSLVPSLRSTRKNISSLERAVSRSNIRNRPSDPPVKEECYEGGEVHDFIWPCSRCRGSSPRENSGLSLVTFHVHDKVTTLEVPVPNLWTWHRDCSRPRLTWLGISMVVFWTWWVAESFACAWYCHHPFSTSHSGFGFDYDAPEPPFVLEKVLYQSLNVGVFMRPLYLLLRFSVRQTASVVGYLAGLISDQSASNAGTGHQAPPIWEGDASMIHDEYL